MMRNIPTWKEVMDYLRTEEHHYGVFEFVYWRCERYWGQRTKRTADIWLGKHPERLDGLFGVLRRIVWKFRNEL